MTRKAWCPQCALVDHVDGLWRCLWCSTVTLGGGTKHRPRGAKFASVRVVREAHRLHAEGMTVLEAARATLDQTGYMREHGYSMTLRGAWSLLGLPTRSRAVAQSLRKRTQTETPRRAMPPSYRADVDTAVLAQLYRELGTTIAAARAVGMSQQGAYERLVKAGVIVPRPRAKPRARSLA